MEKRFFLAIALSFLVLVAYSAIAPKPQSLENKEVNAVLAPPETTSAADSRLPAALLAGVRPSVGTINFHKSLNDKELHKLEFGDLVLMFSAKGGYIASIFDRTLNVELDLKGIGLVPQWGDYDFEVASLPRGLEFTHRTSEGGEIRKTFRIKNDDTMDLTVSQKYINYLKSTDYDIIAASLAHVGPADPIGERYYEGFYQIKNVVYRKPVHGLKNAVLINGRIEWAGLRDRYFSVVFAPQMIVEQGSIQAIDKVPFLKLAIVQNNVDLVDNSIENSFKVYVGLQDEKKLIALGRKAERVVNFGFFDPIAKVILFLLTVIHRLVHSWGFAIIIVTTLIYFILFPLSFKSMTSMKKMQALQPKIEELRAKLKDNPQKLQMATMELYKEEKINPLGGCFPMLLQIPVFFSLYQLLLRFPGLRGASFFWISDLSSPDRLIMLPRAIPIIGNEINILPILMALVMFFQQKISMSSKGATGAAAEQQKIMLIVMPVLFGFLFYKMPAGLVLYWIINSLLMLVFQWKISVAK